MRLLLFLFLFVSCTVSGQTISWETIHLDNLVTFELPKGYSKTGESEAPVFKAKGEYGNLSVSRVPQPGLRTFTKEDLLNFYKEFKAQTISPSDTISFDGPSYIGGLNGNRFLIKKISPKGPLIVDVYLVLIKDVLYIFSSAYTGFSESEFKEEKEHFFRSIAFIGMQSYESQLTNNIGHPIVREIGKVLFYLPFVVVIGVVILWFLKKFKIIRIIKNIIAGICMFFGIIYLLAYIGNKFLTKDEPSFLYYGFILLVLGVIFLIVKIPKNKSQVVNKPE